MSILCWKFKHGISLIISIQIRLDFKYYKVNFNSSNQISHNGYLSFNLSSEQPNIDLSLNWKWKRNILFINFVYDVQLIVYSISVWYIIILDYLDFIEI